MYLERYIQMLRSGEVMNMNELLASMSKEELQQFAKEHGIRLYTVVPEKMRARIEEVMHTREHHGDAFREEKR